MNITTIEISKLRAFEGHPYKVLDNEEMIELAQSIHDSGILSPLIVRPLEGTDEYEVISGHRRLHAAQKAGLTEVPAFIYPIDRDAASILLVDSNLHREHILPSEKAFAYKLKMEAMKRQGKRTDLTSSQVATKWDAAARIGVDTNESRDQVYRYIRLTSLIPELLDMMDEGRIAFSVGVELSYLTEPAQRNLLETIDYYDCTPSYAQAVRMHKMGHLLDAGCIAEILSEEKPNQRGKITLKMDDLRRFFPQDYTPQDMQDAIMDLLEKERRRQRSRDAR